MKTAFPFFPAGVMALALLSTPCVLTAAPLPWTTTGDAELDACFRAETERIASRCLAEIKTLDDWKARRDAYRQQLFEMLGLSPLPPRTDLKAAITGKVDHELFTVEKLHYQSMPGFYVTANLYLPKGLARPAPAILYVCGHSRQAKDGVSFGNKTGYQHHGAWFARNGYVCLTIDTVQLGELEGIHHGTYREGMWWWNARGYTSAGAEAWNCIRALDYLQTRPEVDPDRIGVTGRSGGGAYSWWISALDDRIQAAVPVAGITDLHNHVVDGAVEGHCDCMFMLNTYRWDYAQVAALVAPRPLLIANSDKDRIFPLDGVMRIHAHVRRIYELHGAADKLGVLITEGPHKDTQDLQVPAFRWFNRWLKGDEGPVAMVAEKFFEPAQLKVFDQLPANERTTKIHDTFVAMAANSAPANKDEWARLRDGWLAALKEKSFAGWPETTVPLNEKEVIRANHHNVLFTAYDFTSQPHVRLRLYVAQSPAAKRRADRVVLRVLGEEEWAKWLGMMSAGFAKELSQEVEAFKTANPKADLPVNEPAFNAWLGQFENSRIAHACLAPRGAGLTAFVPDPRKQVQIKRRFQLLGQTLDGMRVWDIRRGVQAVRSLSNTRRSPLELEGEGAMGVNALYASLFEPDIQRLTLAKLPPSHRNGPDYLNVLRFMDVPQALAMAAERSVVQLDGAREDEWNFAAQTAARLAWESLRLTASGN